MNERIEKLAEQAGMIVDKYGLARDAENGLDDGVDIYKFAELIVDQMLEITDAHTEVFQTDRDRGLIEHIKKSVKQHFGVKE
jgi:hypothetical protein